MPQTPSVGWIVGAVIAPPVPPPMPEKAPVIASLVASFEQLVVQVTFQTWPVVLTGIDGETRGFPVQPDAQVVRTGALTTPAPEMVIPVDQPPLVQPVTLSFAVVPTALEMVAVTEAFRLN